MKIKSIIGATCACLAVVSFNVNAITMYDLNSNGDITGVSGLDVGGISWDMTLHDSSFDSLYASIGSAALYGSDFSSNASVALLNFINTTPDTLPTDFYGCTFVDSCFMVTVYAQETERVSGSGVGVLDGNVDYAAIFTPLRDTDYSNVAYATWAESASVPVPAAVWLFGSGLIGLIGLARRK